MRSAGTTPAGTHSEEQAARWVRDMFSGVAGRYDLLNHLLSMNIDKLWRRRVVRRVQPILSRPDARVVDLCCGTGDLLIALETAAGRPLIGSDFCHPMLTAAGAKLEKGRLGSGLFEGDALTLPLRDASVDLITVAFGVRNFANYKRGFREMLRVLRPGGTVAILEFSQPPNRAFAAVYGWYSRQVLPRIGAWVSGSADAYTYLPESVRKFPGAEGLAEELRECGFQQVEFERMTFGIVALHLARI